MIQFSSHSGIYTLQTKLVIPISIDEAWEFFSSPKNLAKITPEHMGFKITSKITESMFPGQIISYRIGLLPGIKSNWVTEITHVSKPNFFVDEQRFGPYAMWHHEHHFEEHENGVLMTDRVSYKLPLGALGRLFHPLLIKPQLKKIFEYRTQVLIKKFKST
ncbi:SRPBCC family protein [Luteibaculum oceani]|uniref:SRPBCC family protein n=1 Tax=Luteibaculum oceani TaxID=1294296 RepID=A0A5C6UT93_9FLAO|nr:SRPBCC family protein [Luteibaculum oceani]TXC76189.1 SRPBCC family protein [Luteibaculum oceani]